MATFVLVHGAFHGGWCWYKVAHLLSQRGHVVLAPDLPGHGRNVAQKPSMAAYVASLVTLIKDRPEPVVLLGHSMGGGVITMVAEAIPDRISKLIYLTAWLGPNGKEMSQELASLAEDDGFLCVPDYNYDQLYHDCLPEDEVLARLCLNLQAAEPLLAPVYWTQERWGRVPCAFIACKNDRAFPIDDQLARAVAGNVAEIVELETGHSPFLSMPEKLTDVLESLAR